VIVPVSGDVVRDPLPAGVALIPDAAGRWWSNWGELETSRELHLVAVPSGTTAVARSRDGYILTDAAQRLLAWSGGNPPRTIVDGPARLLAIADDLVAWSDDRGDATRITNLTTARTTTAKTGGFAISARFSPDRSRLAILLSSNNDFMALADVATGSVLARMTTAVPGRGLPAFDNIALAFEPVPFSWNRSGRELLVVARAGSRSRIDVLDRDGTVKRSRRGPDGLTQLLPLT
jgi:hypothetical protein